jgi:uncharacterized protein (TIGR02466 family)
MYNIFSSFLYEENLNFDIKKMEKEILNFKKNNEGRIFSNYGGWQSDSFIDAVGCFKKFFKQLNLIIKNIEEKLCLTHKLKLDSFWFNVNNFGSFNRPHIHTGSVLSGVYYINIPKNSGNIIFKRDGFRENDIRSVKRYNEYNSSNFKVNPYENLCIIFPSYLEHYVEPNLNKKERISISFNYGF